MSNFKSYFHTIFLKGKIMKKVRKIALAILIMCVISSCTGIGVGIGIPIGPVSVGVGTTIRLPKGKKNKARTTEIKDADINTDDID